MRTRFQGGLLLWLGMLGLLSCAPMPIPQPDAAHPYALLVFPESIRVVEFDTHPLDPRVRQQVFRVTPGRHRLRLAYTGSSPLHVGQQGDPTCLDVQEGHQYHFETWTVGIIWRPIPDTHSVIPGYCTTHQCPEGTLPLGPPLPAALACPPA